MVFTIVVVHPKWCILVFTPPSMGHAGGPIVFSDTFRRIILYACLVTPEYIALGVPGRTDGRIRRKGSKERQKKKIRSVMVISIFHTHECHFLFYFSALRVRSFELFKTNIRARVSHCRLTPKRRFFEIPVQRDSSGGRPKRVRFAVFKRLNCHLDNNRFRLSAGFFCPGAQALRKKSWKEWAKDRSVE